MNGQYVIDGQVRSFARPQFLSCWNRLGLASLGNTPTAAGVISTQDNIIAHWLEVNWSIAWGAGIVSMNADIVIAIGAMGPGKVLSPPAGTTGFGGNISNTGSPNILFHLPFGNTLAASVAGTQAGQQMIDLRRMNISSQTPIVMYFSSNGGGQDIVIGCNMVLCYNSMVELPKQYT